MSLYYTSNKWSHICLARNSYRNVNFVLGCQTRLKQTKRLSRYHEVVSSLYLQTCVFLILSFWLKERDFFFLTWPSNSKICRKNTANLLYEINNLNGRPLRKLLLCNFYSSLISSSICYIFLGVHCRWDISPHRTLKISFIISNFLSHLFWKTSLCAHDFHPSPFFWMFELCFTSNHRFKHFKAFLSLSQGHSIS